MPNHGVLSFDYVSSTVPPQDAEPIDDQVCVLPRRCSNDSFSTDCNPMSMRCHNGPLRRPSLKSHPLALPASPPSTRQKLLEFLHVGLGIAFDHETGALVPDPDNDKADMQIALLRQEMGIHFYVTCDQVVRIMDCFLVREVGGMQ